MRYELNDSLREMQHALATMDLGSESPEKWNLPIMTVKQFYESARFIEEHTALYCVSDFISVAMRGAYDETNCMYSICLGILH